MPAIDVRMPPLHRGRDGVSGGQLEIAMHPARFKVVMCNRRWGKTHLGVALCLKGAAETGGIYWWVTPTYKHARPGWRTLKRLVRQIPGALVHESERYVTLPNGGEVFVQSADDEGSLRGEGLSGVVLDEAAQIAPDRWVLELRPALSDRLGWALFIGTPQGEDNWFFKIYEAAEFRPNWARWKYTAYDAPFVPLDEIEDAKQDMSEQEWLQEYMADVAATSLRVYPMFDKDIHRWTEDLPPFIQYIGGLDFGGTTIGSHKSSGVLAGRTEDDKLICIEEFEQSGPNIAERQVAWMQHCQRLVRNIQNERGGPDLIIWAADKSQMFGIQIMRTSGYVILPSKGGTDSVRNGLQLVQRRLTVRDNNESHLYYWKDLHFIPDALERYRYPDLHDEEYTPQPVNPLKVKDDMADAIRYLVERCDHMALGDPAILYRNQLAVVEA